MKFVPQINTYNKSSSFRKKQNKTKQQLLFHPEAQRVDTHIYMSPLDLAITIPGQVRLSHISPKPIFQENLVA